ncbi:hypothetical protein [Streptomyces atratus]|uniref:hypothetical protein n=1 Tax=Streptomyces atratus TaxID=1893 RepID=UPI0022531D07|nr:hypothetical protein [Streptomyces atratus]MCX5340168.1 hypothetical protein [Streptomyces atratus]
MATKQAAPKAVEAVGELQHRSLVSRWWRRAATGQLDPDRGASASVLQRAKACAVAWRPHLRRAAQSARISIRPLHRSAKRTANCFRLSCRFPRGSGTPPAGTVFNRSRARVTLISFRGLPDPVVAALLFGTQQRLDRHVQLPHTAFKLLRNTARAQQITSLSHLAVEPNTRLPGMWRSTTADIRVGLTTPELEQLKDVWDAEVFGLARGRTLNFTGLHQERMRRADIEAFQ